MFSEPAFPHGGPKVFVHPPDGLPYTVVVAYLDNCRKNLQALKDAIERSDYDFVEVYAHRMKGAGGAYGFPQLTQIGGFIEQASRARNGDALRKGGAALDAHLESLQVVEA